MGDSVVHSHACVEEDDGRDGATSLLGVVRPGSEYKCMMCTVQYASERERANCIYMF